MSARKLNLTALMRVMYKIWIQRNYKNYLYCYGVRLIIVPPLISLSEMLLQLVDSII